MSTSASAAIPLSFFSQNHPLWLTEQVIGDRNRLHLNLKRSAIMSMCHWRHVTCDIHLEGDIRKYIIAIIQSECMISTGGITIENKTYH